MARCRGRRQWMSLVSVLIRLPGRARSTATARCRHHPFRVLGAGRAVGGARPHAAHGCLGRTHRRIAAATVAGGLGASEGFGCDNTTAPSSWYEPEVIVLPDAASGPDDEFAWLAFTGKWGERHVGAYTGPAGPSTKGRRTDPVTWHEGLRDASVTVPAPSGDGNNVIDAFCSVVGWGSIKAIGLQTNPTKSFLVVAALIVVAAWRCRRTVWTSTPTLPLVRRRRSGEIVFTAGRMFIQRPLLWAPIDLVTIPLGVAVTGLIALLAQVPILEAVLSHFSDHGSIASTATSGSSAVMSAVVTASVVAPIVVSTRCPMAATSPGVRP